MTEPIELLEDMLNRWRGQVKTDRLLFRITGLKYFDRSFRNSRMAVVRYKKAIEVLKKKDLLNNKH